MTTKHVVPDEQLGHLGRKYHDLFRRVRDGALPLQAVLDGIQLLMEPTKAGRDAAPPPPKAKKRGDKGDRLATLEDAIAILGKDDILAPQDIREAFGFKPAELPFARTVADLELARALGERLEYRPPFGPSEEPLTMKRLQELADPRLAAANLGRSLYDTKWYQDEAFYLRETLRSGWWFVSKRFITGTAGANFTDQTRILRDEFFSSPLAAADYFQCADETLEVIGRMAGTERGWQAAAAWLAGLLPNRFRRRPGEVVYGCNLRLLARRQRDLLGSYEWTSALHSDGELVGVGHFVAGGAGVVSYQPGDRSGDLGACSSR